MNNLETDFNRYSMQINQFAERLKQHLPHTSDLVLIVLKGHLIIEEIITETLRSLMPNPECYLNTNPSFYTKCFLLKALSPYSFGNVAGLDSVLKLNKIRNKLAHHLEYPEIEKLMEEYLKSLEEIRIKDEKSMDLDFLDKSKSLEDRIRNSICYLAGRLASAAGIAPILNKTNSHSRALFGV